ncbi:MAG TPA: Ig-like domain-containing protein [Longimicrobiales bacterium]|nr:Ig-like domain-containing protein [Longimicrobiales bacterium]
MSIPRLSYRLVLALAGALLLAWACVDGDAPLGPDGVPGARVSLPLQATLIPSPADGAALAIHRVRAVAERIPDRQVLATTVLDVSPTDDQWEIGLEIPLTTPGLQVMVILQLIHVDATGAESVEFAGQAGPIVLAVATQAQQQPVSVEVVRGPTDNLSVTSVTVSGAPATLLEGDSTTLTASVTTSVAGATPTVFWTVLDPAVGTLTGTTVHALLPGTLRVVAFSGKHADTVSIAVAQRPASVSLRPDTIVVVGLGSEGRFSARVLDRRGDSIPGSGVLWRSLGAAVAESAGGGLFRAVGVGITQVEARAAADSTLRARAVFRVDPIVTDLTVTKAASRDSAEVGDTVTFTVAVRNASGPAASGVTVSDSLPAGLSLVGSSATLGAFSDGTWAVGTLQSGASATLRLTTVRTGGANGTTLVNVARASLPAGYADPVPADNRATAAVAAVQRPATLVVSPDSISLTGLGREGSFTARVLDRRGEPVAGASVVWVSLAPSVAESRGAGVFRALALGTAVIEATVAGAPSVRDQASLRVLPVRTDLAVVKSAGRATVEAGDTVTFTVTVTNQGASPVDGVQVLDALPAGLALVESSATAGSFSGGAWGVGTMAAGASATLRMRTRTSAGTGGQNLVNAATVAAPYGYEDTNPGNDRAEAAVQVPLRQADLGITKTVSASSVAAGLDVTFTITVMNGGLYTPDRVVVNDVLPAGLTHKASTATSGSWDPGTGLWELALRAGGSATLSVAATAGADAVGKTLVNAAEIIEAPGVVDPNPENNRAEAAVSVLPSAMEADVRVSKRADRPNPLEGERVIFTLVVANNGPAKATNVVVQDTLPLGLDSVAVDWGFGVTSIGRGLWRVDSLAVGDSTLLFLDSQVEAGTAGDTLVNTLGLVSLDQTDPNGANDKASAAVVVQTLSNVDIEVTKKANPTTVRETGTVTFTVRARNRGSTGATGVAVRDSLRAPFSFVSASATQGSYSDTTRVWTVGALAAGDSAILTLSASVVDGSGGTTASNTASLTALDQPDVVGENDAATVTVTLQKRPLDLSLEKTLDQAAPIEGTKVRYTVTLRNHGPGSATSVQVLDSMPLLMAFDSAKATVGTVAAGGGSWTVPSLAAGDSASLFTYHTVGLGAGGTTLTNRARIAALAQSDTFPSNDAAQVAVTVPTSTPPVVTISSPADGASFDPGDTITFSAVASDLEDGTLTSSITWTSSKNGTIGTGGSFSAYTLSAGPHTIVARVTDLSGTMSADTVKIILAIVGTPPTLNVPFGGSASLPISLSAPAPAGGLSLTVTSTAPGIAQPVASTVTIPEGALSANASIQGILPGTAVIRVASVGYGSDSTLVSVTASLNITQSSLSFPRTMTSDITVRLESAGTVIAAPAGGLTVTLTATNIYCVFAPTPVLIPAGQTQVVATLSYGGESTTPCSSYVKVTATSVVPDSLNVTVNPPPGITVYGGTVGSGLQDNQTAYLGAAAPAGGVTVRVQSADTSRLKVSPNSTTPGTGYIDVLVSAGSSSLSYYAQGMEAQVGTVMVSASAPAYTSGSANWTVVQPALYVAGFPTTTTTLTADDPFYVQIGVPYSTYISPAQAIRAGGTPVTATIVNGTPATGRLATTAGSTDTATVTIGVGQYNSPTTVAAGGVAFDPVAAGTTTVSATIPGFISTTDATRTVTVSAPALTVYSDSYGLGSGLQTSNTVYLGAAAPTGGVTVRVESANPAALLISPNSTTPGAAFVDFVVPAGNTSFTYFAQGLEGISADTPVTVTASAPAYTNGTVGWTVKKAALYLSGVTTSTNTFAADDPFTVIVGVPYSSYVLSQAIRAGGTAVTATVTSSIPAVGQFSTLVGSTGIATVTIPVGSSSSPGTVAAGGVAFDALTAGTTTVSATIPGFTSQTDATRIVTVSAPGITVYSGAVGAGLQTNPYLALGSSGHGGVTVRIQSSAPGILLVSPNASTPGTAFIDVPVAAGTTTVYYYVQGVEGTTGTATLTASAPGFTDGSATWTVETAKLAVIGLTTTTTAAAADDPFEVRVGIAYGTGITTQNIRAGGSAVTATVTASNPAAGTLKVTAGPSASVTVTIPVGAYGSPTSVAGGGVAFDPLAAGSSTVSATIPGFVAQPDATRVVTINP